MSDGKNNDGTPPSEDQRTVFIPSQQDEANPARDEADGTSPWAEPEQSPGEDSDGGDSPNPESWGASSSSWPEADQGTAGEEEATRFEPRVEPAAAAPSVPPPTESGARSSDPPRMPTVPPVVPRDNAQGIRVGDVLNHIFEVTRFIARGGMGEVFEGCNVNSDEKVAIKVMLPALAADPNVISMFRREARTLTRLQHEALVQYRVLAQEPQLGVLYIVTEFVDGVPLSEVLGTLNPSPAELEGLLRRLAAGLRAAHALGILHRDMSPDNVLLEGGRLAGAKIIDFGIAKDLDPGSATIVGDGFAGKLSYVAPEQLGDFGREVGPWSDVYSLALVMLAISMGRDVQMGGTLVDAVDKRRAGPDLTPVPDTLRPVLEMMLRPNPAERLRSMDEVLAALDARTSGGAGRGAGGGEAGEQASGVAGIPKPALIGGAAGLALLVAGGIWMLSSGGEEATPAGAPATTAPVSVSDNPVQAARQAIDAVIPSVTCSWLDIADVRQDGGQLAVSMGGVAGSPSAAQNEIASALSAAGMASANLDFTQVATISPGGCAAIDTYRQIRNTEAPRIATEQRLWEMRKQEEGSTYAGKEAANIVAKMNISDPSLDLTLFGIDPAGILYPFLQRVGGKKTAFFEGEPPVDGWDQAPITDAGNDSHRIEVDLDVEGWQGFVLLTGKGPFPAELVMPPLGTRNTAWQQKFMQSAAKQGWKADMTWFKAVNQRAGD